MEGVFVFLGRSEPVSSDVSRPVLPDLRREKVQDGEMPPSMLKCFPQATHNHDVREIPEVVKQAFTEACNGKDFMSVSDVVSFLNRSSGEDYITEAQAETLLGKSKKDGSDRHLHNLFHHHKKSGTAKEGLDILGFMKLLLSPEVNSILKPKEKSHDMTQPLSHYYVHTSHNSYLTGNQLTSKCSTAPIIDALTQGCRVIELDCWERRGKIKVLHGGTLTKPVKFSDCIKAIKEHAFVASDYPVIITIENHLPEKLQIEAAKIMKDILGELLFIPSPEERPPLEFLSPEALKGKIIISDKPLREPAEEQVEEDPEGAVETAETVIHRGDSSPEVDPKHRHPKVDKKTLEKVAKAYESATPDVEIPLTQEFQDLLYIHCEKPSEMKEKQVKGGPLKPGDRAIMANLSEPQLKNFIKTHPGSVIEYTRMNMGRMYPFGLRFDSSNADPTWAWSHGFQMAALNLQGKDRPAWLGQGFFLANGGCGYVRKPDFLLPEDSTDYEQILNQLPKLVLKVTVLLGTHWHTHFDYFKKPDFYVKVALHGIPTDALKKRTQTSAANKEPHWEDEEFEFPIRVPDIAILRFEVWEHDRASFDDFVGQACLPVSEIRRGIRVVQLRSKKGKLRSSKLLVNLKLESLDVSQPTNSAQ
ncbi:hypothetical protein R1flu_026544 [Riccia fluitans]|uniref:Phosphoinositide phospholipase C n=1 Tax=Riccia fluitans TaxID=41844 RepID=A0ABD1XG98_9MARC